MRQITKTVYKINEHPNKEKCFEWVRENWHDLNQHSVDEVINSIKALSDKVGGSFDYSISQWPDQGEHITFKGYDKTILDSLDAETCPLTGVCWDIDLIVGLREDNSNKVLSSLHEDTKYIYSSEGLLNHLEWNDGEFNEDGSFYVGGL